MSGTVNCVPPIQYLTVGCMSDVESARVLNAEGMRGLITAYRYNNDPSLQAFIDTLYSAMWSKPGTGGPNPDGTYISAMDDTGFYMTGAPPIGAAPKYFGQFFGVTSLSNWPGARIGGVAALSPVSVQVAFNLGAVPSAVTADVTTTSPSGQVTVTQCSSSPCNVSVDSRQGDHLFELQYLSESIKVLASSQAHLIQ
jgi:hypothetical protein